MPTCLQSCCLLLGLFDMQALKGISRLFVRSIRYSTTSAIGQTDIYVTSNLDLRRKDGVKPLSGVQVALLNRSGIGGFSANILEDYGASVRTFCEVFYCVFL